MVSIRRGFLSSKRNFGEKSVGLLGDGGLTQDPQNRGTNGKRPWKPEVNTSMADDDFSNLYLLVQTATHLAENGAQKRQRGMEVKDNTPESQSAERKKTPGDFLTQTTSSGLQYILMYKGDQASPNGEMSRGLPGLLPDISPTALNLKSTVAVQPRMSSITRMKVATPAAAQPQANAILKMKVRTTAAVPPRMSAVTRTKVATTAAVLPQVSAITRTKVATTTAQPQASPIPKMKVRTTAAVPPRVSAVIRTKVATTAAVLPRMGSITRTKVATPAAAQPQTSPISKMKVRTTAAVPPRVSAVTRTKVATTAAVPPRVSATASTLRVRQSRPKPLRVQTTGGNSMMPDERLAADSAERTENTPNRLDRHGIAVYNKDSRRWTAYIWDGKDFYRDDSVKTPKITPEDSEKVPKNATDRSSKTPKSTEPDAMTKFKKSGAHLLEILHGVCLPDATQLGLHGINFYKRIGRWTAHIWDEKQFYIGSYASASEAARAYDKASLKFLDAVAAQAPNYRGTYDYAEDVKEMATLTQIQFRDLLNKRAKLSKHIHVSEGVSRCPEGRFEVRIRRQAEKKWEFLGRFDNPEAAKRWYQMASRWYEKKDKSPECEES